MREKKKKLERIVGFRMSVDDHELYLSRVAASGKSPSAYFRDCVLSDATQLVINGSVLTIDQMERRGRAAAVMLAANKPKIKNKDMQNILFLYNKTNNDIEKMAISIYSDHFSRKLPERDYVEILRTLQSIQLFLREAS